LEYIQIFTFNENLKFAFFATYSLIKPRF